MKHARETITDGDLYDIREPGKFIVDCSCGETYLVCEQGDPPTRCNGLSTFTRGFRSAGL
jgi:hypothetical protein